eukprot:12885848-Prorocentrum_lima.AAC.1
MRWSWQQQSPTLLVSPSFLPSKVALMSRRVRLCFELENPVGAGRQQAGALSAGALSCPAQSSRPSSAALPGGL